MKKISLMTIVVYCILNTAVAFCQVLSWDTNVDADYYIVYWGVLIGKYDDHSEKVFAPKCSYEIPVANNGKYFAVKAFNDCGNSSEFSEPVKALGGSTIILKPLLNCSMSQLIILYEEPQQ